MKKLLLLIIVLISVPGLLMAGNGLSIESYDVDGIIFGQEYASVKSSGAYILMDVGMTGVSSLKVHHRRKTSDKTYTKNFKGKEGITEFDSDSWELKMAKDGLWLTAKKEENGFKEKLAGKFIVDKEGFLKFRVTDGSLNFSKEKGGPESNLKLARSDYYVDVLNVRLRKDLKIYYFKREGGFLLENGSLARGAYLKSLITKINNIGGWVAKNSCKIFMAN